MNSIKLGNFTIDVFSNDSISVHTDNFEVYVDISTGEQIIDVTHKADLQ